MLLLFTIARKDKNRLNMSDAFKKYNDYSLNVSNRTNSNQLVGEYYFQNNLLIQLISRNKNKVEGELDLEEMVDYYREVYTENNIDEELYYVGEVISRNNFRCLVYYDKRQTSINFLIKDNAGKYRVSGGIFFKFNSLNNARAFFDNFINGITLK